MRTLQDAVRAGLSLEITCGGCGRVAVYGAMGFLGYLRENAGGLSLATLERRLRCEGEPNGMKGCGHKGARIVAIEWPPGEGCAAAQAGNKGVSPGRLARPRLDRNPRS